MPVIVLGCLLTCGIPNACAIASILVGIGTGRNHLSLFSPPPPLFLSLFSIIVRFFVHQKGTPIVGDLGLLWVFDNGGDRELEAIESKCRYDELDCELVAVE